MGMAYFRAGDVSEARRAFSRAIDISLAADMPIAAVPLLCHLAEVCLLQGQLRQAMQISKRAMQLGAVDGRPVSAAGFAGLELAKIQYERNELPEAERYLSEGLELLSRGGIAESFGNMYAVLAQVKQAQGDFKGAQEAIQQAMQVVPDGDIPRLSIQVSAYQARIWLAQGRLDLAARWACDYGRVGETEYLREFEDLTLARVLLAQGELSAALALLDALLSSAEAAGRMGRVIEMLALRALALRALGDLDGALGALGRALRLAEPEGYVRVFLDEGKPMGELLRQMAAGGIATDCAGRLLAVLGSESKDDTQAARLTSLAEPLTGREMEVLQLLAQGFTNPEIAQRLFISLPTVKSHTRNIYGKLGVHSRREAAAQARTLGILPPV
jgi:LuxR family maltose regulon positive regulatory protein